MKYIIITILSFELISCKGVKDLAGVYNNSHSGDKHGFAQYILFSNGTMKKEIEFGAIRDFYEGVWVKKAKLVIFYTNKSASNFPPDTIITKIRNGKMFFLNKNGKIEKKQYLLRSK